MECVESVQGRVRDENGDSVAAVPITVCGPVCFRAETDEDGDYQVTVGAFLDPSRYSISAHGGPLGSTFYLKLPSPAEGLVLADELLVLPFDAAGGVIIDKTDAEAGVAQTLRAGPLQVEVPEGAVVRLNPSDVLGGVEGRRFREREVQVSLFPEFGVHPSLGRLFALGPFEARFEGARVGIRIDNDDHWAPGAQVAFLALGTYLDETWLPAAEFREIGRGLVDASGEQLVLDSDAPGSGLRFLTWLWVVPLE